MVLLKTNRTYYDAKEAAEDSMTVGELIKELEHLDCNDKVVFCNDNGYTFGYVTESVVKEV